MKSRYLKMMLVVPGLVLVMGGCAATSLQKDLTIERGRGKDLAGTWKGTFLNTATNRSGFIELTLLEESASTPGSVQLRAPEKEELYQVFDAELRGTRSPIRPMGLTISFLQFTDGIVQGVLEPYEDPERRCLVVTSFEGRMKDGKIVGTFSTRGAGTGPVPTGTWSVVQISARR